MIDERTYIRLGQIVQEHFHVAPSHQIILIPFRDRAYKTFEVEVPNHRMISPHGIDKVRLEKFVVRETGQEIWAGYSRIGNILVVEIPPDDPK